MTEDDAVHVTFHTVRSRKDGDEWIVGCLDTGQVLAVPDVGMAAMKLLLEGHTIAQTRRALHDATGSDIDVRVFVEGLAASGLVSSIGPQAFPRKPAKVTLSTLQPRHTRWAVHPALHTVILSVAVAGLGAAAVTPQILPGWGDLLWTEYGTFTLVTQSLVAWCLILFHEMAHLLTARAVGVPGRIRLGTRMQFLVAQTEVSGIWLSSRRERLTVYLSGTALDAAVAGGCLLATAAGCESPLLAVIVLTVLYSFVGQCLVFMRTDLYFVIQDLTGCRNLYSDSVAYLRYLAARLMRRSPDSPLAQLRGSERRAIRIFTVIMVVGTTVCITVAIQLLREVTWVLIARSATVLQHDPGRLAQLDALTTVIVVVALQVLWVRLWWRQHSAKVRKIWRTVRPARDSASM
ncbi:hypothetical protein GCM10010284_67770 [Streptomyces rubiginosohelvolus]|uniref:hypothetical protein n=1 Tax=Streptomyces rubiginosohelvolus TaxID=67362 RepID=UPI001677CE37|nr:hypothetical protein [Streptomyces rubiginosohelvolus]GGS25294.1 hypothetical protein GCM10010284_67770 [Streptomyces rubiginosohelvolus]